MSRRFFVSGIRHSNETLPIEGGDAHHIADVLRLHAGDRIEIVDSGANAFVAELTGAGKNLKARLLNEKPKAPPAPVRIDLAQAVPKGPKMDAIVEKATELGVAAFLPFWCERSVAHGVAGARLERWRRIARSAAAQCGRLELPAITAPLSFADLLERFNEYDVVLFAWESARDEPLRDRLPALLAAVKRVLVVVGPEGGFSHAEADAAIEHGAEIISLGERILRTETAAPALLAILNYVTG
jgi:16S rRNA (uracil1498-N3)-methyltransferase